MINRKQKYKCYFCAGLFNSPIDRIEHMRSEMRRIIAAGNKLLQEFDLMHKEEK